MKIALDTNRYVDFARGDAEVVQTMERVEEIMIPLIVLAELRAGFMVGSQGARNEGGLRRFLLQPGVSLIAPDEQTTHHYAAVYRQLRQQGTPIPTNDIWIAALTIQHGLVLYARDAHFDHLPQLPRI
ncbi:MAG: type II toxin-antitoxin system VapC family toxin [Gemmatimonadaceae bacterium]